MLEKFYEIDHIVTAFAKIAVGDAQGEQANYKSCTEHIERSLRSYELFYGKDSIKNCELHKKLAIAYFSLG